VPHQPFMFHVAQFSINSNVLKYIFQQE